ncbi:MAG: hypothetical protein CSA97_03275 [Bacteroidetes bacterium]|nr:MAG: hypothetical protein CSA97_03275 [Bacteroidota bacterium]
MKQLSHYLMPLVLLMGLAFALPACNKDDADDQLEKKTESTPAQELVPNPSGKPRQDKNAPSARFFYDAELKHEATTIRTELYIRVQCHKEELDRKASIAKFRGAEIPLTFLNEGAPFEYRTRLVLDLQGTEFRKDDILTLELRDARGRNSTVNLAIGFFTKVLTGLVENMHGYHGGFNFQLEEEVKVSSENYDMASVGGRENNDYISSDDAVFLDGYGFVTHRYKGSHIKFVKLDAKKEADIAAMTEQEASDLYKGGTLDIDVNEGDRYLIKAHDEYIIILFGPVVDDPIPTGDVRKKRSFKYFRLEQPNPIHNPIPNP